MQESGVQEEICSFKQMVTEGIPVRGYLSKDWEELTGYFLDIKLMWKTGNCKLKRYQ